MKYHKRNYDFGQTMQTLRTAIGLTQAELANHLGVSRRAVGEWEAGSSYPKAGHLKEFIILAVEQQAFATGHEAEEIRGFWDAARQKVRLDEYWLSALLDQQGLQFSPSPPLAPVEKTKSSTSALAYPASGPRAPAASARVDWGDALAVPTFYGREREMAQLIQWVAQEHCRLVGVLGMGGIGKSALTVSIVPQLAGHFDVVIFRSLRDAPALEALIDEWLRVLSPQPLSAVPGSLEQRVSLLLSHLCETRVLLVLDNLESLLKDADIQGNLRPGFEEYGQLLWRVAETPHRSCLLFTSREKPAVLKKLSAKYFSVRSLRLAGLDRAACKQLFREKELLGTEAEWEHLIEAYSGNPLALKIVAETILDIFAGQTGLFLVEDTMVFGDISELLGKQFARLSELEQIVLCWLAIVREPVTIDELLAMLVPPLPRVQMLEAVDAGYRCSLIEPGKCPGSFTLQSVVLEFVTALLIAEGSREIQLHRFDRLIKHGLCQSHAKEYVRQAQERLLLLPVLANLRSAYQRREEVEQQLLGLLDELRKQDASVQGYGPANLIALLRLLRGNLNGLDLSRLCIRGACLQGIEMQDVSLSEALISDTIFTEAVSVTWGVTINRDGTLWAASGMQGMVRIWREGGQNLYRIWQAHADVVQALAFSPDGQTLASGSLDGTVKLWNVERGTLLWTSWQNHLLNLAFSPDGNLLASIGMDATVRLWDTLDGTNLQMLRHPDQVVAIAWSPDGSLLASGCFDGQLRLWERRNAEPSTSAEILSLQTSWESSPVGSLAFAPNGRILVSADWNRMVKLWEVPCGRLLRTFEGELNTVNRVIWSPDGRFLASCSYNKAIWLWDVEQDRYRAALVGHTADITGMAFTPDSSRLLSSSSDSTLRVWDMESCQCVRVMQGYAVSLYSLDWSPDGTHLVSGGTHEPVTIWDLSGETPPRVLRGHTWIVWGVGWSPDGRLLASCGWDRAMRLWDPTSGDNVQMFENPSDISLSLAWSPEGNLLASGTYLRGMHVWDVTAHRLCWVGKPYQTALCRVAWSPDGTQLAGAGDNDCVYLWDRTDGTLLKSLPGHQGQVMSIAWHPDGRWLASGSGGSGEILIWDVQSGKCIQTLKDHPTLATALAWSQDGDWLVSGGVDGTLGWWEVQRGKCTSIQFAHHGTIKSIRISPGGRRLASCGEDGAIHIWDLTSHEHLQTLRHNRPYERLNITGIRGLVEAEITSLKALGAIECDSFDPKP